MRYNARTNLIYVNVLDSSFDEENIDWEMYRMVEYKRMLNWTIDRFFPEDFYFDKSKIVRNRVFLTGVNIPTPLFSGDVGYWV